MPKDLLYSSRKLRRKRFFRNIFFFLAFLVGGVALVAAFFSLSFFRVRTIVFTGNRILPTTELEQEAARELASRYFFIIPGDNLIVLRPEKLIAALSNAFPRIEYAKAVKKYPNTLTLTLKERDNRTVWCKDAQELRCMFVGQDGVLFEEAPIFEGRLLLKIVDERTQNDYHLGASALPFDTMRAIESFRDLLARRILAQLYVVRIKNGGAIEMEVSEGWYAIVNADLNPDEAVENLVIVFAKNLKDQREKLEYIDLRFGNKLYYKLK